MRKGKLLRVGLLMAAVLLWVSGCGKAEQRKAVPEVSQKTELVMAALWSGTMTDAVLDFNKSQNQYHLNVKYYDECDESNASYQDLLARFNADLVSEDRCPDLVVFETYGVDITSYAKMGILEDLSAYLDNSSVLQRASFTPKVLDAVTHEGVLFALPRTFYINTICGKASLLGEKEGWTIKDITECVKQNSDKKLLNYNKTGILRVFLLRNMAQFVDLEKGICSFDSDEFKEILEFCSYFPDEETDFDYNAMVDDLRNERQLLYSDSLSEPFSLQRTRELFGNADVTYLGYPTADGTGGNLLHLDGLIGIPSAISDEHKKGAWEFLEWYVSGANVDSMSCFAAYQPLLDEQFDKAMDTQFANKMNAQPVSQEEKALVFRLLENSVPYQGNVAEKLMPIITEEAAFYYSGQKSVDDVVKLIQKRASVFCCENQGKVVR